MRQQHGRADALVSDLSGLPEARRTVGGSALPPADRDVGQHRQPDRAARSRNGVGQLLHDAGREARGRTRLQLGRKTISVYQGHPVVVLGYDYWVRRFARDPSVVGKKILVNNYPMTIVGVSAAGFAGLDPSRAPQIRVPILMKPVLVPEWEWVRMDDPRTRWVQVFARLKTGTDDRIGAGAAAGALHADSQARDDAAGRERLVAVHARTLHGGQAAARERGHRLLEPAQRLLDAAHRADVAWSASCC